MSTHATFPPRSPSSARATNGVATDARWRRRRGRRQTCAALYVVGTIAGLIPMLTLVYVAFVLLFTVPKGYQLKKPEVDKVAPPRQLTSKQPHLHWRAVASAEPAIVIVLHPVVGGHFCRRGVSVVVGVRWRDLARGGAGWCTALSLEHCTTLVPPHGSVSP